MSAPLPVDISKVNPAAAWQPWQPEANEWSTKWAAHLFRRAGFGASPFELEWAVEDGFAATLDRFLQGSSETAKREAMLADLGQELARDDDSTKLRGWWLYAMIHSGHPLREKLTLFWHNHFATSISKVQSPLLMVGQNQTLRKHALGKFRPFLLDMSRDVAMLIYLDSNENVKAHPNENYAREVMELFSLGVGNYTEKDVQEAARAFTGWHTDDEQRKFAFNADEHDDGVKTVLEKTGKWNGDDVLRIILDRPAAARFLVSKVYRDFVSETDPPKELLEPLADRFRKSEYDIADLVKTVLSSRLFFSEHAYLKRIKSPAEFMLGAVRSAWSGPPALASLSIELDAMGQTLFAPPNVKGWPGGKVWLNNATLLARNNFAEWVATRVGTPQNTVPRELLRTPTLNATGEVALSSPQPPKLPPGGWNAEPPEPPAAFDSSMYARERKARTPKEIIARLAEQFFPGGINPRAATKLEAFIADGNPKDKELNRRIREAAHAMMCMPEYQLC
jgi:Protein of unknown function (DUF1800)